MTNIQIFQITATKTYNERFNEVSPAPESCILDTLAQLRKTDKTAAASPPLLDKKNLEKRARSKFVSNALALALVDTNSILQQSYWNTFHCNELLTQDGRSVTGKYCNNRWCNTCNRIRTAKLIRGYTSPLAELKDKQFVTLTIPNVKGSYLETAIKDMAGAFAEIKDVLRKRKMPVIGIRKTECTYNDVDDTYHPHFHFVISGESIAHQIVDEWLKRFPEAKMAAQDVRQADDDSVQELFKYFTKIATYSKIDKKRKIYACALDVIFVAMRNKRVFQPMGIKRVSEDIEELDTQQYNIEEKNCTWSWVPECHDWVDISTGEALTNFVPTVGVLELLNNIVTRRPPT